MLSCFVVLVGAGLCSAVLQALRTGNKSVHGLLLSKLCTFFSSASDDTHTLAMKVLAGGGLVEFTMDHMAKAGLDELECAAGLFTNFIKHPLGRERMSAPKMAVRLAEWISKWLSQVWGGAAQ